MNMRLACDLCGSQPCMCVQAECRTCQGEGEAPRIGWVPPHSDRYADTPSDPPMVACEDCGGTGQIKCDGPRQDGRCKFAPPPGIEGDYFCYCEAAYDREQERLNSGEPPVSARERMLRAHEERQALRQGRPL